jgi:hypothetical protein
MLRARVTVAKPHLHFGGSKVVMFDMALAFLQIATT